MVQQENRQVTLNFARPISDDELANLMIVINPGRNVDTDNQVQLLYVAGSSISFVDDSNRTIATIGRSETPRTEVTMTLYAQGVSSDYTVSMIQRSGSITPVFGFSDSQVSFPLIINYNDGSDGEIPIMVSSNRPLSNSELIGHLKLAVIRQGEYYVMTAQQNSDSGFRFYDPKDDSDIADGAWDNYECELIFRPNQGEQFSFVGLTWDEPHVLEVDDLLGLGTDDDDSWLIEAVSDQEPLLTIYNEILIYSPGGADANDNVYLHRIKCNTVDGYINTATIDENRRIDSTSCEEIGHYTQALFESIRSFIENFLHDNVGGEINVIWGDDMRLEDINFKIGSTNVVPFTLIQ